MRSSRAPPSPTGQRARREAWRPTCAPSPTAAATRFTEPERTSPMAKTQALSCLQQATLLLRAGQHEAFRVHSDARSGQPGRIRLRSDEKKGVTQRPAHFVAGIGLPPADRLQHAVAAFENGDSGLPPRATRRARSIRSTNWRAKSRGSWKPVAGKAFVHDAHQYFDTRSCLPRWARSRWARRCSASHGATTANAVAVDIGLCVIDPFRVVDRLVEPVLPRVDRSVDTAIAAA